MKPAQVRGRPRRLGRRSGGFGGRRVDVVLVHPGQPHPLYKNSTDYLIDRLLK
jgi:hypothetical protein